MKYRLLTHVGNVRKNNEDACVAIPDLGLFAVADGLGGQSAGEIASNLAIETLAQHVQEGGSLVSAIIKADRAIVRAQSQPGCSGMATTVVACQVSPQDGRMHVAWVGDSRAYKLSRPRAGQPGRFCVLSEDHTPVQELVRKGEVSWEYSRLHPQANLVSQALGAPGPDGEVVVSEVYGFLDPGDRVLLCSDGLSGLLEDQEIHALLGLPTVDEAAAALVQEALDAGGHDNVTVAVLECGRLSALLMGEE